MFSTPRKIELLAPARNADIAIEAIRHGADAVYIGSPSHGARAAAANSVADIARAADFAHRFECRIYVTLNTLIYDNEIRQVERLVGELYRCGVDALIVQDMALLRMDIPPIALHASTQCDIRSPRKARFLADAGFSQLVLPRELTLAETAEIHKAVPATPLEAFVHGALCVSYSGDCQAGFATMGRSANRGECPQICRHRFNLMDAAGNILIHDRHLLSLRDLNRSRLLAEMIQSGISSFKIEGRLKDMAYVKNVVGAYRRLLDEIIDASGDALQRSSIGRTELSFVPDLSKSFNRGYTEYFSTSSRPTGQMASTLSPKWIGEEVGKVVRSGRRSIQARLSTSIANGDGLVFFDANGEFKGFRVNSADSSGTLTTLAPCNPPAGATLYRNSDRLRAAMLEGPTARRLIELTMRLKAVGSAGFALMLSTPCGHRTSTFIECEHQAARSPQASTHRETLTKTGDTDFTVSEFTDEAQAFFIPRSRLAELRRKALAAMTRCIALKRRVDYRISENHDIPLHCAPAIDRHENVANHLAEKFYTDHGATTIQPAVEVQIPPEETPLRVMTTRYCLRREMGRCLLTPQGRKWPQPLFLQSGPMRFAIDFDCRKCSMHIDSLR